MTTFIRDVESAKIMNAMIEMGCYDHEYYTYGCAYLEDEKIKFRLSGDWSRINSFIQECSTNELYPTPIMENMQRQAVLSGTEENVELILKLKLARKLQETYGRNYFEALAILGRQGNNDGAGTLIDDFQEEITGYYDADQLQLFEGLVQMACAAKVLTKSHAEQALQWLAKIRMQMEDDVVIKQRFSRTFACFISQKENQAMGFTINANEKSLTEQKWSAEKTGLLTTPIFKKTYWYPEAPDLAAFKEKFHLAVKKLMSDSYLARVTAIRNLPPAIDQATFATQLEIVEKTCSAEATASLRSYGYRWNVLL